MASPVGAQPTDAPKPADSGIPLGGIMSFASGGWAIFLFIIGLLPWFFFSYGAARLSYMKYQSYGWAVLDFFFSGFYYPFYAWFLAEPPTPSFPVVGGRRR